MGIFKKTIILGFAKSDAIKQTTDSTKINRPEHNIRMY